MKPGDTGKRAGSVSICVCSECVRKVGNSTHSEHQPFSRSGKSYARALPENSEPRRVLWETPRAPETLRHAFDIRRVCDGVRHAHIRFDARALSVPVQRPGDGKSLSASEVYKGALALNGE